MKKIRDVSFTILVLASVSSCDEPSNDVSIDEWASNEPVNDQLRAGEVIDEVHGELLETVQIGEDHKVDFYDFGNGSLAARETLNADTADELLEGVEARELAEIYGLIKPGEPVPQSIIDADRDAAEIRRVNTELASSRPPKPEPDHDPEAPPEGRVALSCSGDFFGDNWGANWFLNNYCYATAAPYKTCQTNWGWHDHTEYFGSYLKFWQFEGDFNEPGATQGWKWECGWSLFTGWRCWWAPQWNHPVGPRQVVLWIFTDSDGGWANVAGQSPCGHLGLVIAHD